MCVREMGEVSLVPRPGDKAIGEKVKFDECQLAFTFFQHLI